MPNLRVNLSDEMIARMRQDVIASDTELTFSEINRRALEAYYKEDNLPNVVNEYLERTRDVSALLDQWRIDNGMHVLPGSVDLREILNQLNPEVHACYNQNCKVDTWTGLVGNCPECEQDGLFLGRMLQ